MLHCLGLFMVYWLNVTKLPLIATVIIISECVAQVSDAIDQVSGAADTINGATATVMEQLALIGGGQELVSLYFM